MRFEDILGRYIGDDSQLFDEFKETGPKNLVFLHLLIHDRNSLELYFDLFRYEEKPELIGVDFYLVRNSNRHLVYSTDPKRFFKGHGIHSCLEECARVLRDVYGEEIKLDYLING